MGRESVYRFKVWFKKEDGTYDYHRGWLLRFVVASSVEEAEQKIIKHGEDVRNLINKEMIYEFVQAEIDEVII